MKTRITAAAMVSLALGLFAPSLVAQAPPAEFLARVADTYRSAFQFHDSRKDGRLTRAEVRGNLLLEARFDDIDINRDGVITAEELERFLSSMPATAR